MKENFLLEARKECGYTRDKVSELSNISSERIEKIENGKVLRIFPDEVRDLARVYEKPELCNFYCKNLCELGVDNREVSSKDLGHIAIETVNSLNALNEVKDKLLLIAEDEKILEDEYEDFKDIRTCLEKLATSADNLKLWLDKELIKGGLSKKI